MKYRYRVYDHHKGVWLPGDYASKELAIELGFTANFSKYALNGCLLRHRYKIEAANGVIEKDDGKRIPPELLGEWDRTRLKILGVKKNG